MFLCFFMFLMRYVGLLIARLCFMSDTVLFIHCLYCIDLFSCIAASLFNKLTSLYYTLTRHVSVQPSDPSLSHQPVGHGSVRMRLCHVQSGRQGQKLDVS